MKKVVFLLVLTTSTLILQSCFTQVPISETKPQNNQTYNVEYLFEHDGCKVYRFIDRGNCVYFTNCNGMVTNIQNDSTRTVTITNNDIKK